MFSSTILSSLLAGRFADGAAAEPYVALIDEEGLPNVQLLQKKLDVHTRARKAPQEDAVSDEILLFQSDVKVQTTDKLQQWLAQDGPDENDALKLRALVETLAKEVSQGKTAIDDSTKEALTSMKKTLADTSEVEILTAHAGDQSLLKRFAEAGAACGHEFRRDSEEDALLGNDVESGSATHARCRDTLRGNKADNTEHCGNLDDFHRSLNVPTCNVPDQRDEVGSYLDKLHVWSNSNLATYTELERFCSDAKKVYESKRDTCADQQAQYETGFCQYRLALHETCYTNTQCYDEAAAEFEQAKSSALNNAESRKLEWTAIDKIKCYIDILVDDSKEQSDRQKGMNACQDLHTKTNHLDIHVPDLALKEPCDLSSVTSAYPGSSDFKMRYEGMVDLHDILDCAPLQPHLSGIEGGEALKVKWVGCYKDDDYRDLPIAMATGYGTIAACSKACSGYKFMALQYYGECFCGDSYFNGAQYAPVSDAECGSPCAHETASVEPQYCGMAWRNSVYELLQEATAAPTTTTTTYKAAASRCQWSHTMIDTYIGGCSKKCAAFDTLAEAKEACDQEATCGGVTKAGKSYQLRSGPSSAFSPSGEQSWSCGTESFQA